MRSLRQARRHRGLTYPRPALPGTRVALDLVGGDSGPGAVVDGALLAAADPGVEIVLVGPADLAAALLAERGASLPVVHAAEAVRMCVVGHGAASADDVAGCIRAAVQAFRAKVPA